MPSDRAADLLELARAPETFVAGSIFFDSDMAPVALRAARLVSATALRLFGRPGTGSSGWPPVAALSYSITLAIPGWSGSFDRGSLGISLSCERPRGAQAIDPPSATFAILAGFQLVRRRRSGAGASSQLQCRKLCRAFRGAKLYALRGAPASSPKLAQSLYCALRGRTPFLVEAIR